MKKQKLSILLLGTVMALTFAGCTDDTPQPEPEPEPVSMHLKRTQWECHMSITSFNLEVDDYLYFLTDSTGVKVFHIKYGGGQSSQSTHRFQYTFDDPYGMIQYLDENNGTPIHYNAEDTTLTTQRNNEVFHRIADLPRPINE